ncbi:hypothetical protein Dimus_021445 [Dionaea muscipula]
MTKVRTLSTLLPFHHTTTTTIPLANPFTEEEENHGDQSDGDSSFLRRGQSSSEAGSHWSSRLSIIPKSPTPICSANTSSRSTDSAIPSSPSCIADHFPRSPSSSSPLLSPIHKSSKFSCDLGKLSGPIKEVSDHSVVMYGKNDEDCWSHESGSTVSTVYESAKSSREMKKDAERGDVHPPCEYVDGGRWMRRSKPYSEFLDEVKRQQIDAQIETWKKAKDDNLRNRLRTKEADIDEWEWRQIHKAQQEMKNYEKLLQEKQVRALQRMQEKIHSINMEAKNRKAREQHSFLSETSKVAKISEKMHTTKSAIWLKLISLY